MIRIKPPLFAYDKIYLIIKPSGNVCIIKYGAIFSKTLRTIYGDVTVGDHIAFSEDSLIFELDEDELNSHVYLDYISKNI